MAAAHSVGLPVAIVAGSVVIGLSLFFGLRQQPAVSGPRSTPPAVTGSPAIAPAEAAPAVVPVPIVSLEERVRQQAQATLDAVRPGLRQACWTPPAAGEPEAITLDFDVTFGPDGSLVVLGISEQRAAFRSSVAECVRNHPQRPALTIDPPGEQVRVALQLRLP